MRVDIDRDLYGVMHWSLNVTFGESRIRRGNAPEIADALRRHALSILQRDTSVKIARFEAKDSRQDGAMMSSKGF